MSTKRIIIADTDEEYVVSIQHKFIEEFFGEIDLEIITERQYFEEEFSLPQKAEILILADELYDASILRHNIDYVFVLTEKKETDNKTKNKVFKIFKYSNIREIFGEILSKSENVLKDIGHDKQKTQIILVDSASGGAGKTTVALGVSANLTKSYKKVVYINAAFMNTFQHVIGLNENINDDKYPLFYSEQNISYENIKSIIRNNEFDYILPFSQPLISLGIEYSIYAKIIQVIKESGEYDFIVVDSDTGFNEDKVKLISLADNVIMVLNQNINSVNATEIMIKSVNNIDSDGYIFVCNNYDATEENAIKTNQILKSKVENYIGHISDYDRKKCGEIAQEIEIKKISYLFV